jgi:hypothetical protein
MSTRMDHHALDPRGLAQHGGLVNRAAHHFNPRVLAQTEAP